ncbi:MAG: 4-(cytidine 5'-diphospho)-2-C-methyl-D-erythritol kinase [Clostridia bacterium]|nr:4-(cytidine 5'-diphospho)-2-C-methyl-D-erythritol kinase [Clostridia bacterium]
MHTERANAKINAYLNILSRRPNGYHDIVSVMQTVSLCDLVSVDFIPKPQSHITLSISGNAELPTDHNNLATRAAERFLQCTNLTGDVQISIQKHIPVCAGLGGGSADAAAVLRALNSLCGNPFTVDELCEIGFSLGADVPFCIRGGTMLATGVGEVLERAPEMPDCALVIAMGDVGISTPAAYAALDEKYGFFATPNTKKGSEGELLSFWQKGDLAASATCFYNIFEEAVPKENTDVERIHRIMKEKGSMASLMSGSGPSVFGVFDDLEQAEKASDALQKEGFRAFVCQPKRQYAE